MVYFGRNVAIGATLELPARSLLDGPIEATRGWEPPAKIGLV